MIKLCKVLAFNKITHIIVSEFDGIQIQFVTDKDSIGSLAYIKNDNSNYEIVDESEYEKSLKTKKKIKAENEIISDDINYKMIVD